ncbi:hypothetical protein QN277_014392 [Acacia crassicarpa]|uniref:RNase H type-1 domain-containing protein n=1 Tax=Acacia crassicarpa TaxID=499986 RepID=A0AAE1IMS8_9FABA|nr:hypothetical protein QN277_014392 [Acacia crassicarpa]
MINLSLRLNCEDQITGWEKPPHGWLKLNVDGASTIQSSKAGCGGVIRDCLGNWVVGFAKSIGDCNASNAEEWAIVEGLQLAWDLGFKKIILESDASSVVNVLLDISCATCNSLLLTARDLMTLNWQVDVRVIPREFNRIADALAKRGISNSILLDECPTSLRAWLDQECLGLNSPIV